jgi:hypothetical protein
MRVRWLGGLVLLLVVIPAIAACKENGKGKADPQAAKATAQAEEDLLARRDALLSSRTQLDDQKVKLEAELAEARKSGADTSEIELKLAEVSTQQTANQGELIDFYRRQNEQYKIELDALRSSTAGSKGADTAQLLSQLQRRDAQLAEMEKKLGSLAGQLTEIRADIQKQAESCTGGGSTIIAATLPKGTRYSKSDVMDVLKKARSMRDKRGIQLADLDSAIQGLEKEATSSMQDGEMGKAYLAATTLLQAIEGTKIDKQFVTDKMKRVNRAVKAVKLDDAKNREVGELLKEIGDRYNDGDFPGANKRLNEIQRKL